MSSLLYPLVFALFRMFMLYIRLIIGVIVDLCDFQLFCLVFPLGHSNTVIGFTFSFGKKTLLFDTCAVERCIYTQT